MTTEAISKDKALVIPPSALESFSEDVGLLWCPIIIPNLPRPPTSLNFSRDYVARNRPCIIRNAIIDQEGIPLHLTLDDITDKINPQTKITVDCTPDGHGDVVRAVRLADGSMQKTFVRPHEQEMTLEEFHKRLRLQTEISPVDGPADHFGRKILSPASQEGKVVDNSASSLPDNSILYYSRQNDCLRTEFESVQEVFPPTIDWAEAAIGNGPPDAINLWIGNRKAVSSMHKDHYENLFYVLHGEKIFTICPPADAAFLYEREFKIGVFVPQDDWKVRLEDDLVRWIEPDVEVLLQEGEAKASLLREFPLLKYAHPIQVHVRAGEMLYLPSLWFHRVTQTCETMGVNYWFDMKFDSPNWCYFHLLQQLQLEKVQDGDE